MKTSLALGALALNLAAVAAHAQTLQPFPPLAPLPAFTPAAQLTTVALAQQDLNANNALLASLQQQYNDTDSRLQTLSPQMARLLDAKRRFEAAKQNQENWAVADVTTSIMSFGLGGLLNGYAISNLDSAISAVNAAIAQLSALLSGLPQRENALRSEMGAVKAQISVDGGALAKAKAQLPPAPAPPAPVAPAANPPTASPATPPAPVDPIAAAVKAATAQIDAAIATGLKNLKSAPAKVRAPIQEAEDKLDDMKSSDEDQISALGTKYEAAWQKPSLVKSSPAAMMPALNADLQALLPKQGQAITTTVQTAIAAASGRNAK